MNYLAPLLSPLLPSRAQTIRDASYGVHPEQTADLYLLPYQAPVMVFIHGGGWSSGDKSAYQGRAKLYNLAGFHVFSINYRLATHSDASTHWPAQMADCSLALAWIRTLPLVDSSNVFVGGDSAGGHLALMLGTAPKKPRAILNMFGPTDLSVLDALICTLPLFGGKPADATACPVALATGSFPPTITMHGTRDAVVPYSQAQELDGRLKALGVDHKLVTFDGGHEFADLPWWRQKWLELYGLWWLMRRVI